MELKQITKQYGNNTVIDRVDFAFNDSKIVGLIGKNGVGDNAIMMIVQ